MEKIQRIIQESVPGKQITLAHVIASPIDDVYDALGVEHDGAVGILALSPYETSMIAADVASKAADVTIGFLDRFTGSVIIQGDVESVEIALQEVLRVFSYDLAFAVERITKT